MRVATTRTVSLHGASGELIDVQVDLARGLVRTALVGRPDAAISEARDRCRAAVVNSGYEWPTSERVTILLSPADLPKRGPHFDLAIAVGVLAAAGVVPADAVRDLLLVGELTLEGRLRAVPGVLPMVLAASRRGVRRVVVPEPQTEEAAMVPDTTVLGVRSLNQVVALLRGDPVPEAAPVEPLSTGPLLGWRGAERLAEVDLADVLGMADGRFALEVAAAGGHHLMLSGPKGSGKTTLAERLPALLPDLSVEESLELTALHSLAGELRPGQGLLTRPPFRAPHHSASKASLLGGGSGRVRPGEVSRAHRGCLFLDELPLFATDLLDALREPLESGEITIARGEEVATFPARTLVVGAANPCPCGDYHPFDRDHRCRCSEVRRREYRARISGPLADRFDITRHVEPVRRHEVEDPLAVPEPTTAVRARVTTARARQAERYDGTAWRTNADVPGPVLRQRWPLSPDLEHRVTEQVYAGRLTRRGATRVHRLAWTLCDLAGEDRPGQDHVDAAVCLRTGEPLLDRVLTGRRP